MKTIITHEQAKALCGNIPSGINRQVAVLSYLPHYKYIAYVLPVGYILFTEQTKYSSFLTKETIYPSEYGLRRMIGEAVIQFSEKDMETLKITFPNITFEWYAEINGGELFISNDIIYTWHKNTYLVFNWTHSDIKKAQKALGINRNPKKK